VDPAVIINKLKSENPGSIRGEEVRTVRYLGIVLILGRLVAKVYTQENEMNHLLMHAAGHQNISEILNKPIYKREKLLNCKRK